MQDGDPARCRLKHPFPWGAPARRGDRLRFFSQACSFATCTDGSDGTLAGKPDGTPRSDDRQPGVADYLGHGVTLAASTLLFLWLGTIVDDWLGTEPWLTLLGAFVGAGAGFYHMIHHLVIVPRDEERRKRGE
ncbi:MAG: AtpZ/AtpI family protein [Gemmatimonadota bacterium]